jgi:hypothetical protein
MKILNLWSKLYRKRLVINKLRNRSTEDIKSVAKNYTYNNCVKNVQLKKIVCEIQNWVKLLKLGESRSRLLLRQ